MEGVGDFGHQHGQVLGMGRVQGGFDVQVDAVQVEGHRLLDLVNHPRTAVSGTGQVGHGENAWKRQTGKDRFRTLSSQNPTK